MLTFQVTSSSKKNPKSTIGFFSKRYHARGNNSNNPAHLRTIGQQAAAQGVNDAAARSQLNRNRVPDLSDEHLDEAESLDQEKKNKKFTMGLSSTTHPDVFDNPNRGSPSNKTDVG